MRSFSSFLNEAKNDPERWKDTAAGKRESKVARQLKRVEKKKLKEQTEDEGQHDSFLNKVGFRKSASESGIYYPRGGLNHVNALQQIHGQMVANGHEHSYDDMPHLQSLGQGYHSHDYDQPNGGRLSVMMKGPSITHVEHVPGYNREPVHEAATYKFRGEPVEGVETKRAETPGFASEKHSVSYGGQHIGHVYANLTSAVRKKNSVRMVDTGKKRLRWGYDHANGGHYFGLNNKKDAVEELLSHHLVHHHKKNEETIDEMSRGYRRAIRSLDRPKYAGTMGPRGVLYGMTKDGAKKHMQGNLRYKDKEWKAAYADVAKDKGWNEEHLGFKKLEGKLAHEKGVRDPGALAASIGRKKYGSKGMARKVNK